jgi:hypothetical protein
MVPPCPGIFKRDDYPGESIFCVHDCHKKNNLDVDDLVGPPNTSPHAGHFIR